MVEPEDSSRFGLDRSNDFARKWPGMRQSLSRNYFLSTIYLTLSSQTNTVPVELLRSSSVNGVLNTRSLFLVLKQFVRRMKWNSELRRIVLLGALMLPAISLGCGARSDLASINGRVKFKSGEAINRGTIEYARTDPGVANQTGARIVDGAYEIPQEKGLRAGKYVVRI